MFHDRTDAGWELAGALSAYKGRDPLVIALPRGGVPVAAPVAVALNAPLDVLLVRKISAPGQPELAAAAIAEGTPPTLVRNREIITHFDITDAYLESTSTDMLASMARKRQSLGMEGGPPNVTGRTVILVDDGVATGATTKAAITALRAQGVAHLCLAVPVAPKDAVPDLARLVDDLVCLDQPGFFRAVGMHYANFDQTSDEEVARLLGDARARQGLAH